MLLIFWANFLVLSLHNFGPLATLQVQLQNNSIIFNFAQECITIILIFMWKVLLAVIIYIFIILQTSRLI